MRYYGSWVANTQSVVFSPLGLLPFEGFFFLYGGSFSIGRSFSPPQYVVFLHVRGVLFFPLFFGHRVLAISSTWVASINHRELSRRFSVETTRPPPRRRCCREHLYNPYLRLSSPSFFFGRVLGLKRRPLVCSKLEEAFPRRASTANISTFDTTFVLFTFILHCYGLDMQILFFSWCHCCRLDSPHCC